MNYMHKQGVCLHCTVAHCSLDYLKLYLFPQFYGTHSKMYTISLMIGPIRSKLALCRTVHGLVLDAVFNIFAVNNLKI